MSDETHSVKAVFGKALEIDSPEERSAYLDQACGGDPQLRAEVEDLLQAIDQAGSFMARPVLEPQASVDASPITEKPGTQIGPYKLLQKIGEGGMGVVYMAEQSEPVDRRVALKIIKPGMDTRQVIGRFEAERQALAMMDHPNIAKGLDAGTTDSGRPYFVMELVGGTPITQYADDHHLTPRERLELFVPVCQAIQHAHQKGILHRDIKPTNVLVAEFDDRAVPKIIDFGVAKAIEKRLTEKTMFTHFGQMVGTIDYMSPEQANLNQFDIDTRTDVYSLGVLLYELLTGQTPFDRQRLHTAAFDEMLRIIREEEPPKPSIRLSTSQSLPSIAANRKVEPKKLGTLVRGELDWIVMKALEKDRTRRYETANGFANDIQRYLNDEPVAACPPSAAYRFRKFARRNRVVLSMVAVVSTALLLGIVGTTWQAIRATNERNRALAAEQLARDEAARADNEATNATTEAAIAQAVNDFLNYDLLAQAHPEVARANRENEPDRDIKLRTLLDRASDKIEERFANKPPLVEAGIRQTLGYTYSGLGDYEKVEQHFRRVREIHQRELGPEDLRTLASMNTLANAIRDQGRPEEAEKLHAKVLEIRRRVLGPEHPVTLESMNNMAVAIHDQGRYEEAEKRWRDVLEIQRRVLGPEHPDTLATMNNLAIAIFYYGRYEEAEKRWRDVLEIQRQVLPPEHPDTLRTLNNLAGTIRHQGRYEEAEKLFRQVLEIRCKVLPPEHPFTLRTMCNLASTIRDQGRYREAEKLCGKVLEAQQRVLGREHPDTLYSMHELAVAISGLGRYEEAEKRCREVLEIERRVLPPEDPNMLRCMLDLATAICRQGRHEEAEKRYREVLEIQRRVRGPEHPDTLGNMGDVARAIARQGRHQEAEKRYREVLEIQRRVRGPKHPDTLRSMCGLALAICQQGRHEEAEKLYREVLEIQRGVLGPEHPETLKTMHELALAIDGQGRHEEAEKRYREVLEISSRVLGPEHPDTLASMHQLAIAIFDQGRYEEAEKLFRQVLEVEREVLPPEHPDTLASMHELAMAICAQGRHEEAEELYRKVLEIRIEVLGPEHPKTLNSRHGLVEALALQGRYEDAEKLYRDVLDDWKTLADKFPNVPAYRVNLGGGYCNLGLVLTAAGRSEEALDCFARAQEELERVLRDFPTHGTAASYLRNVHRGRAGALKRLGRDEKAAQDH